MARYKITIEYDGGRYSGWQIQRGEKTVQGAYFTACEKAFGEKTRFEFIGSGRTDAGVHALAQVAHLDVKTSLSTEQIRRALNDNLPYDINTLDVERVADDFHSRKDAKARSYVYLLSKRRTAFAKNYAWWMRHTLDVESMRAAAKLLQGRHNFESFTDKDAESSTREVVLNFVDIYESEDMIAIHITGSHFLWKMVRRIVGVLIEIGRGNIAPVELKAMLASYSPVPAEHTAPACGLYLQHVYYQGEEIERSANVIPPILL